MLSLVLPQTPASSGSGASRANAVADDVMAAESTNILPGTDASTPRMLSSKSSWRILELLKIQNSPKVASSSEKLSHKHSSHQKSQETIISRCICCDTVISYSPDVNKFRCAVCQTKNDSGPIKLIIGKHEDSSNYPHLISYRYVRKMVDTCVQNNSSSNADTASESGSTGHKSMHELFEPLSLYLLKAFSSPICLNHSFRLRSHSKRAHYSTSNVDTNDIRHTFNLLTKLPSKRPLYNALYGANECLKKLNTNMFDDARYMHWILVLLEIPFLSRALIHTNSKKSHNNHYKSMADVPEIRALSYELLKRILGVLAHSEGSNSNNYIASWFSKLPEPEFIAKVDLINLYITFHLKKFYYMTNNPGVMRRKSHGSSSPMEITYNSPPSVSPIQSRQEYFDCSISKDEVEEINLLNAPLLQIGQSIKKTSSQDIKIKIHLYGNDWHLRTAGQTLAIFMKANSIRMKPTRLPINVFYNSLVDFVNIKLDFDSWQTNENSRKVPSTSSQPEIQTVIDYINGKQSPFREGATFFFCQYPHLISLGSKVSILEYEARRQMERKAEEAFINSLDKRVALDVYFRVRIRRSHIVQDSLNCIKMNSSNLKKSLRVQFINEPGVDAGGLKKEWFLLLTRSLFSPETGMLYNVEDSNYLWFNISTIENYETYYLFGSILGLAIYNSTILDLKFPLTLYKLLIDKPIGLSDYQELFPQSFQHLIKIRDYSAEELDDLDLYFEISYHDTFKNKVVSKELTPNGGNIKVSIDNREVYIGNYCHFFLIDAIKDKVESFVKGFHHVIGGNALSLFLAEEIQLLICGSDEEQFDIEILKSVTKYSGWSNREEAINDNIIVWFWEYLQGLTYQQQRRFLLFVTGSDRVPATGVQNLTFKISKTRNYDTQRLPVAHTCFNELEIYRYSTKDKMVSKINQAVNESSGFGIK